MNHGNCYNFWGMVTKRNGPAVGTRAQISYRVVSVQPEYGFDQDNVRPKGALVDGAEVLAADPGDPAIICVRINSVFVILPTEGNTSAVCAPPG